MGEKSSEFLRRNAGFFAAGAVSLAYLFTAFVTVEGTGKSLSRIIADAALAFFLGFFINRLFDLQGLAIGDRDPRMEAAARAHGELVARLSPYMDRLADFCARENAENYRTQRTRLLAGGGLRYADCFSEDGLPFPYAAGPRRTREEKRAEKRRHRAWARAVRLRLSPVTPENLTGEGGCAEDPFRFGRSKGQYEKQASLSEVISKAGTSLIFGYYGVRLVEEFSYAALIWTVLQICLFLAMGVLRMQRARRFIVEEYRGRVLRKTDLLRKFEIGVLPAARDGARMPPDGAFPGGAPAVPDGIREREKETRECP